MQEKGDFVSESFVEVLRTMQPEYAAKFKILKNKLFIPQNELKGMLEFYSSWLLNAGVGAYSTEKLTSRIFPRSNLTLFYLPEGKEVQIGYFANLPENLDLKISISNSVPINATDYLHPRDNDFKELPGIEVRRPLNQPLEIVFNLSGEKLKCSESFLRKIVSTLRLSNNVSAKYPQISSSLKEALLPLKNILEQTRNLSKSGRPIIPLKYKDDASVRFFTYMHLVIVEKNFVLLDFFENKGRGFDVFLNDEIVYLVDVLKIKNIDTLQIMPRDKFLLGRIRIAGKWFVIEKKAFRYLIESAARSRWFKGKLPKLFTIQDVLDPLAPVLKNADWIDVSKLGRISATTSTKNSRPRFELKYSPWTFKTGKNYSIIEFVEGGGGDQKSDSSQSRRR